MLWFGIVSNYWKIQSIGINSHKSLQFVWYLFKTYSYLKVTNSTTAHIYGTTVRFYIEMYLNTCTILIIT